MSVTPREGGDVTLDLYVMQRSVNKIVQCISLEYLPAALVCNFWLALIQNTSGARHVNGAHDKLLRHIHGWHKLKRPNDEEVASSKKHTQFKTRVHKPYPISVRNGQN